MKSAPSRVCARRLPEIRQTLISRALTERAERFAREPAGASVLVPLRGHRRGCDAARRAAITGSSFDCRGAFGLNIDVREFSSGFSLADKGLSTSPRPLPWLGLFYNDSMMRPPR